MFLSHDSIFWPDFTHVKKRKEFIFVNFEYIENFNEICKNYHGAMPSFS